MKYLISVFLILIILVSCSITGDDTPSNDDGGTTVTDVTFTIGMEYQGGKLAYILESGDPGYVSGETHGLIAATADLNTAIPWITGGATQTTENSSTSTDLGTGQANTTAIIAQAAAAGNTDLSTYAAGICDSYTNTDTGTGVYSDWYLPSKDELEKLRVSSSSNAVGGYDDGSYWSSSEYNSTDAWLWPWGDEDMIYGWSTPENYHQTKDPARNGRVRAVRTF